MSAPDWLLAEVEKAMGCERRDTGDGPAICWTHTPGALSWPDWPCPEAARVADALAPKIEERERETEALATALALVIYDAHPVYGSTTKWRGGIGGQAMSSHCSLTQGAPPGDEWAEFDLPSTALRDWLRARDERGESFALDDAKERMKADLRAVLADEAVSRGE